MSSDVTPDWSSDFEKYKKLSRKVITNKDIIKFFDENQKAFYLDSFSSSWTNMMEAYEKQDKLSSDKLNELEEMQWLDMPEKLKLFAYDYCIKNGFCFTATAN